MSDQPLIDARPDHLEIIRAIMRRHVPKRKVWVFGSRVTWTAKTYSDLDLVILGDEPLDLGVLASLKEDFSESDLPWKVDVVDWASTSESFRKVIKKNKVEFLLGEEREEICLEELITFNPTIRLKKGHIAPFIDMASLPTVDRYIPTVSEKTFSGSGAKFEDGDTLFARITPCLENGKGGFVRGLGDGVVAHGSTEFIVFRAKNSSNEEFAYYISRLPEFRLFAEKQMSGTSGRQRVSWQSLKNFNVFDFKPCERAAIASVLGSLDNKIDLNRQMNETLEAMARAIFKDWFVDFGPTRAKMEGHEPYLAPEVWGLFPEKLDEEEKPEGWNWGTLADVADTNSDSWTARNHPEAVEYVDLSNTKWGTIESTAHLMWSNAPSRARRLARKGDTIVGTTRPGNGSFSYISRDGLTVSTGFAVLTPKDPVFRDIVYVAATSRKNIDRLANLADGHGGAYPAVKPSEVSDTELVIADEKITAKFATLASEIRAKIETAKAESLTLGQTRDLLLPKLMSGEIRVKDAEEIAEEAT